MRFNKRGLTTDEAVRAIANALGVSARDVGVAGMKDKIAVTTQTVSLAIPRAADKGADFIARAETLALHGITVEEAKRHPHKLRTGHLAGNRFSVHVRGLDPSAVPGVRASLEKVGREGLPNAFGAQRFGRDKDNAERARAWLSGRAAPPRDQRLRRLLFSALQSELFNTVLEARVKSGSWATPLLGDVLKRRSSGGLFLCTDVEEDTRRALLGEVSPTGPIFGVKMMNAEGAPAELEAKVLAERLGQGVDLGTTKALGEGTRRSLRLWVDDLRVESVPADGEQQASLRVYFVLPKGAYATTVIGAVVDCEAPAASQAGEAPSDT